MERKFICKTACSADTQIEIHSEGTRLTVGSRKKKLSLIRRHTKREKIEEILKLNQLNDFYIVPGVANNFHAYMSISSQSTSRELKPWKLET